MTDDASTLLALQRATHATFGVIMREGADLDHSPAELNVLATLADGRERRISDLGADVGSKPATLTGVLDRLESRGLLVRRAHPADRRAVTIELTPAGATRAAQVRRLFARVEAEALARLDVTAVDGLRRALRALGEAK